MLLAFAGAFSGALVASQIPREAFEPIVLVVLVVVGAYVLLKPSLGEPRRCASPAAGTSPPRSRSAS